MYNTGDIIIDERYWTECVQRICQVNTHEFYADDHSVLEMKILKSTNDKVYQNIYLNIPICNSHLILKPDTYLQFYRKKEDNWNTRICYWEPGDNNPKTFYMNGDFPLYIVPMMSHNERIFHIDVYKYDENITNPMHYISNQYNEIKIDESLDNYTRRYDYVSYAKTPNQKDCPCVHMYMEPVICIRRRNDLDILNMIFSIFGV